MVKYSEEPLEKRSKRETDFKLCIKCQTSNKDLLRSNPSESSYDNFLKCINERASYGEHEFILLSDSLSNFTACQLREHNAVWHKKCYADTTNKCHIQRSRDRHEKAISLCDFSQLAKRRGRHPEIISAHSNTDDTYSTNKVTRSKTQKYIKEMCFFVSR